MSVSRLRDIPGFNIDRVAAAAGDDPGVQQRVRSGRNPRGTRRAARRSGGRERRVAAAPRPAEVSRRLLEQKVAATPMRGWGGAVADRHVRFVFSNEPVERLTMLGARVRRALESARAAT